MAYEALKGIVAAPIQPMKPPYCGVGCLRTRTSEAGFASAICAKPYDVAACGLVL